MNLLKAYELRGYIDFLTTKVVSVINEQKIKRKKRNYFHKKLLCTKFI